MTQCDVKREEGFAMKSMEIKGYDVEGIGKLGLM